MIAQIVCTLFTITSSWNNMQTNLIFCKSAAIDITEKKKTIIYYFRIYYFWKKLIYWNWIGLELKDLSWNLNEKWINFFIPEFELIKLNWKEFELIKWYWPQFWQLVVETMNLEIAQYYSNLNIMYLFGTTNNSVVKQCQMYIYY